MLEYHNDNLNNISTNNKKIPNVSNTSSEIRKYNSKNIKKMDEPNKIIKVQGDDEKIVEMTSGAAQRSVVLKDMIENYPDDPVYTIKSVKGDTLEKIKEYLEHYANSEPPIVPKPLKSSDFKECVDEWDYNFIGKVDDNEILENMILAANFMNIKPLLILLAAKIASKIKDVNTQTIRTVFGIKELNEEEKKQFKEDKDYLEQNINI